MKFKFVSVLTCMALMAGFTSCSNSDDDKDIAPEHGTRAVTLKANILGASDTRHVDDELAGGLKPAVHDLWAVFVTSGANIQKVIKLDNTEVTSATGQRVEDIPNAADAVYIIGNTSKFKLDGGAEIVDLNAITNSEGDLKDLMFNIANQYDAAGTGVNKSDPRQVNISGYTNYDNTTGSVTVNVDVRPSVARLEIAKISATDDSDSPLNVEVTHVFVDNTYTKIGLDYTVVPTDALDILAFNSESPEWTTTPANYPPNFCDAITGAAASEFTPAAPANVWSYYVTPGANHPVIKDASGNVIALNATPVIVVRLKDPSTTGAFRYVTVRRMKEANGTIVNEFKPGYSYYIKDLKFKIGQTTTVPLDPKTTYDCDVVVEIKQWVHVDIEPEI
ncbi:hypothetical protein [Bacteroides sp. 519]|uniref:hypothetical protein n=1 Tax=Bacteroides sp. 519 TaxID=2302937 RepID=UPI00194020C7|nr:hypothetical protein [Bacteroides sp. 519]